MFGLELNEWLLIITSVVTIASVIVKLTPNKWDDNLVSKLLQLLALNKK